MSDKSFTDLLLTKIQSYEDEVALVDDSSERKSLTFNQLFNQVRNCAGYLYQQGLRKRDVVVLCSSNCLEFPVVMLGIMACGATVSLCSPTATEEQMLKHFKHCMPTMVIATEQVAETIDRVVQMIHSTRKVIICGESEKYITTSYFLHYDSDFPRVEINPNHDAAIMPYSGDENGTLKDKSVTHQHLSRSVVSTVETLPLSKNIQNGPQVIFVDIPMTGTLIMKNMFACIYAGYTLIFRNSCDTKSMLNAIQKYKVTKVITSATAAEELTSEDDDYESPSIQTIQLFGKILQPELIHKIEMKYNVNVEESEPSTNSISEVLLKTP